MPFVRILYLTIHCAATPEGREVSADDIAKWDTAKFGQESYHWIVTLDGTKHRRMADSVRGAHTGGHNTGNIGVCYVGGMDAKMAKPKDTRTDAQKQALREIVADYRKLYPGIKVMGHRDWSPDVNKNGKVDPFEYVKACPSFDVLSEYGS